MKKNNEYLISDIKIVYTPSVKPIHRLKAKDPKTAYKLFKENWDMDTIYLIEEFKIMLLNRVNRVLGIKTIGIGGTDHVSIDPKIIFLYALGSLASKIILAHNHPSGELAPSKPDIETTEKILIAAKQVGFKIVDHLIITPDGFTSLAEEGHM
jgi:DNA repair protein RadC